jgi:acetate kinase
MKVLVLNCGSSSVKFQLIETSLESIENNTEQFLAAGGVDKIGMDASIITYQRRDEPPVKTSALILEHEKAIEKVLAALTDPKRGVISDKSEIGAVGHRVVHGGEKFSGSVLITEEIVAEIRDCIDLAPLHNPHNLKGYNVARRFLPDIPHAAVFDTAFHQSMPQRAYMYGLPYVLYPRHGIRRYGFHGTSHRYLIFRLEKLRQRPREEFKAITIHLGNGCSMAAVQGGKSIDTSMGFTPLEGLLMGTRSGDMDPAVLLHVMAKEELSLHEANTMLNKHSGLIGISGVSNDMRELEKQAEAGNQQAQLAIEMFCYRVRKYIAAYSAALEGPHYIAFTAGIGENSAQVRAESCKGLEFMGVKIDPARNAAMNGKEGLISTDDSKIEVWVIPTNEELVIARDTIRAIEGVI